MAESSHEQTTEKSLWIAGDPDANPHTHLVADAKLGARARALWCGGDWAALLELPANGINSASDCADISLWVADAASQLSQVCAAKHHLKRASDHGVSDAALGRTLLAGLLHSLGCAKLINRCDADAMKHFRDAISIGQPGADAKSYGQMRAVRETARLGLLSQGAGILQQQIESAAQDRRVRAARLTMLESGLELLRVELRLAQQRQQLFPRVQSAESSSAESATPGLFNHDWREAIRKNSVSQLGQDLWVLERTEYKREGFFVEFGATDGVMLSNTWLLERQFGWQGICAEPNPKFFDLLKQNRSCTVSNHYIAGVTGKTVSFVLSDEYGGSVEYLYDDTHGEKRAAFLTAGHTMQLVSISLDEFLEENSAPREIDYISIDTEGSEWEILSAFPFDKWKVKLFTIEHNFTERRSEIRKLMHAKGYQCQEAKFDDWYWLESAA